MSLNPTTNLKKSSPHLSKNAIKEFFKRLKAQNPHPKTELYYTNPYTLLIAVVLSAQATDKGVNQATQVLFKKVQSPEDMLCLGEETLKQYIQTIGLYPTKARHIMALSRILMEKYQGHVPSSREALEAFPGVGRKTANVVLNVAFDQPTIPVDTHIFRVANRTGLAQGKTPFQVEEVLEKRVPKAFKEGAHHWLILLGRYTCQARKPRCTTCVVCDLCLFPNKTASCAQKTPLKKSTP
jgi:endonuclease-3